MSLNLMRTSLAKIDIFGQNITLNMNKNASYTTAFGGFSSILIICLLSLIFFSNITEFFAKQNVYFTQETTFTNDPALMQMNDQNSMFAISIDQTNFTSNPFFNISVQQRVYQRLTNGTTIKTNIELALEPCKLERFNDIFLKEGINFTDQFDFLGLKNMLCPAVNYTFQMQGTYSSETFKFMKIVVQDCKNNSNQTLWNPTCGTEAARTKYLNTNGVFKLQVYQINAVVNPQKAQDYKTVYMDSDMYFTFVPFKLARLANVYYRSFLVNNDNSLLPYQDIQQEELIVRQADDFRDLTELGRDTDDQYAVVYLRRSPFTENINRRFQKLGDLLAYLGGFMQIMRVIFGVVIAFYNRTSMLIELSNKLYDFKDSLGRQLIEQKTLKHTEQLATLGDQRQNKRLQTDEIKNIEWKDFIIQLVQRSKPISFNFKLFINQLSFGYLLKDKNSEFLNRAMNKINSELDLHSILYQLHEINKLKQVLLRKSQIILFNFSPKPIITLGKEQSVPSRLEVEDHDNRQSYVKNKDDSPNEELFYKLQDAYKVILEEMDSNQSNLCQMNINLKLTQLIGQDITKLLRTSQSQKNNESPNHNQSFNKILLEQ